MIFHPNKKYLFLSPHADDIEHGCAGTISKLLRTGVEPENIYVVIFSLCNESLVGKFAEKENIMESEALLSLRKLGLHSDSKHFRVHHYMVRHFPEVRQGILDKLINLKNLIDPEYVFVPCTTDVHQDHSTITHESIRAFRTSASILGYEVAPANNITSNNTMLVKLLSTDIDKKINAIKCYKSQLAKAENLNLIHRIKTLANVRGSMVKEQYAEMFEIIRLIS